ncbi:hypothetical protein PYH37_004368 [Sinorhizobium numidicum]|uniref:Uncharacterized protein n=1 Tax=Sinorhizobium numidicum TaxID=680248 RepID=A0ABY8CVT5_9HYPH|nr:hypothetical protein [Sinorhizobium numidicum]WEX76097.1 hypothetical protein PYH37_004368 [Sinorhizobium numidicum]WEX82756.1 hypothetical protein PYH38_005080 [Sinorhizobium numidicum]
MPQERYELVLDPTDHWTVWDNVTGVPVVFADRILGGLTEDEAEAALKLLVELDRNRATAAVGDAA